MPDPSPPAPPAWIRELVAAYVFDATARLEIGSEVEELLLDELVAFGTAVAARVEAETRQRINALPGLRHEINSSYVLLNRQDVLTALAAPESQP